MKWIKRITDYYNDKRLADKCGLKVKDICVHELKLIIYPKAGTSEMWECIKCGEFHR